MFRSVFVLSSFALFGLAFGSKINCPVSIRGLPGQLFLGPIGMSSGTVDVWVNADSKKWPGWEVVLTFDKDVKWISGFQHHDKNKCNGKTCSFLRDNWIAKKGQRNSNLDLKLDLGFLMWYQRYSKPPKVIGAKIASTQLDEKHRTYYDLCSKEEPIVIKPKPENVYPKCDEKFVKITTRQHNKGGYNGELFLIYPKTILNYKVEVKMNKPFDQMNVFNGPQMQREKMYLPQP